MNTKTRIRQAGIRDLSRAVPIFDDYREHFGQRKNPDAAEKFLFEKFERQESVIFIAEHGNRVAGFAQLYPSFSSLSLRRIWILNDFFIAKDCRGRGIGKQLFAEVREFSVLTGAKGIELTVEHTNTRGWRFWEGLGFEMDEAFRHYFCKL